MWVMQSKSSSNWLKENQCRLEQINRFISSFPEKMKTHINLCKGHKLYNALYTSIQARLKEGQKFTIRQNELINYYLIAVNKDTKEMAMHNNGLDLR